jgi:hypothetical protein
VAGAPRAQGLEQAVALSGTLLNGEQLFVAKSAPPGAGGRGGGGRFGYQQQQQQQGGRGGGGRGRGRGGFGTPPVDRPGLGHQHQRLNLGGELVLRVDGAGASPMRHPRACCSWMQVCRGCVGLTLARCWASAVRTSLAA